MTRDVVVTTSDGVDLWATVTGAGPPVVLCHGGPGLWDYLSDLGDLLSDEFTVYRWDQRGCGRSSSASGISLRRTLDDLDELRSFFGHARWSVVGHSWGAYLALLYGLLFEANAACVAYLCGTGPPGWWRAIGRPQDRENRARVMSPEQLDRLSALEQLGSRDADAEREFRMLSWAPDFRDGLSSPALAVMAETALPINFEANETLKADPIFDDSALEDRCRRARNPMLFLHGELDTRPAAGAQLLAEWVPTSDWYLVPGAGHMPWVEQPELVRARLTSFLRGAATSTHRPSETPAVGRPREPDPPRPASAR